ncbi:MAG TPA: type II secretion system F family protein, partial [Candidatus Paceibacterota bacterium]
MKFTVVAKTAEGTEVKRVVDAPSRFAVYEQMEKEGALVVSVAQGGGSKLPAWTQITIGTGVKMQEKITFTKNLAAMISAGLTLTRALSVIERQSTNKALKKIVIDLEGEVKKGASFHEALARHPKVFSELFIAMTKAGEESGTLAESLAVVARQMDKAHTLQKKVKGAMIYPVIILSAIVIIGVLMMIYVVPTLSNTFKELGVELPTATRIIIDISDFMAGNAL